MRSKLESVRVEEHVIGDFARGLQIFIEQRRRHRQRLAGIIESSHIGRIHRELARGTNVDSRQIANAVVIFRVAEPTGKDDARIAVILACLDFPRGLNPIDHVLPRLIRGLLHLPGRHLLGGESRHDAIPACIVVDNRRRRLVAPQIELCRSLVSAVATRAIGVEERPDRVREFALCVGIGRSRLHSRRNEASKDEQGCKHQSTWHGHFQIRA